MVTFLVFRANFKNALCRSISLSCAGFAQKKTASFGPSAAATQFFCVKTAPQTFVGVLGVVRVNTNIRSLLASSLRAEHGRTCENFNF